MTEDIEENISTLPFGLNFPKQESIKIYGPPGTGKTTKLINYVVDFVSKGISPKNISFISFSNAAANVAKKRIAEALPEIGTIEFPNFSTMHALATRVGNSMGTELMTDAHFNQFDPQISCWKEWTELGNPLSATDRFSHPVLDQFSLFNSRIGEMKFLYKGGIWNDVKRYQLIDSLVNFLKIDPPFDMDQDKLLNDLSHKYINAFIAFKKDNKLVNFDDVINVVSDESFPQKYIPTFEILIIDEAQDLSKNLWVFANKLIMNAEKTFLAGDDDQSIMTGIGADPKTFIQFKTTNEDDILEISYRIPVKLRNYIDKGVMPDLINVTGRVDKNWFPTPKDGEIELSINNRTIDTQHIIKCVKEDYLSFINKDALKIRNFTSEIGKDLLKDAIAYNSIEINFEKLSLISCKYYNCEIPFDLFYKIGNGIINPYELLTKICTEKNIIFNQEYSVPNILKLMVPDWLIMAPTKVTGENISKALKEMKIPHFYRNVPILDALTENTKIRVQTIHISKGDEAKNTAIIVEREGDVMTLTRDPRLAYVALSRSSKKCFPRVYGNDLIRTMRTHRYAPFAMAAGIYNRWFPNN
jgi:hypothetical protein